MFDRIVSNQDILHGKPCIRGTRISVEFILELMASGGTREIILKDYPYLTAEDIEESLRYAAQFLSNEVVISAEVGE
jgi:uncharacterized protein (DUF433 family)